jgi:FixJ family two-component response regulator
MRGNFQQPARVEPEASFGNEVSNVTGDAMSAASGRELNPGPKPLGIPIVFVVDDDTAVRESLDSLVTGAGWRSETFGSAQEFLAQPRAVVPSCLVLDVSLPGINGLDLQQRIAIERTAMPIIFITGYGDVPMTVKAMKAGAVEFLTKPFRSEVLLSAIRHAIEISKAAVRDEQEMEVLRDCYASLTGREREVMGL